MRLLRITVLKVNQIHKPFSHHIYNISKYHEKKKKKKKKIKKKKKKKGHNFFAAVFFTA